MKRLIRKVFPELADEIASMIELYKEHPIIFNFQYGIKLKIFIVLLVAIMILLYILVSSLLSRI